MNRLPKERRGISQCPLPKVKESVFYIERLQGNDTQSFVVYGSKIWGYYTHWNGTKCVPCWEDHSYCDGGHKEHTLRENYLLQVYSAKKQKQVFLYLTPGGVLSLQSQVPEGHPYRGLVIRVYRTTKGNGRLRCEVERFAEQRKVDAPDVDPYESVMALLKVPEEVWKERRRSLGTIPDPSSRHEVNGKCLKALGGA
jgi:hypothetical protein